MTLRAAAVRRRIRHVDAFTSTPLEGNPAAVVDGEGIDPEMMQRIALNQKLSETVFLLPPESIANHARLRIFTPAVELPFAGHPTLAAAHILASERLVTLAEGAPLRLETGAGLVPVEIGGDPVRYTMTQQRPQFRPSPHAPEMLAAALGLERPDILRVEDVNTGIWWTIVQLASFPAMLRVVPDMTALRRADVSLFCIGAGTPEADIRVRTFVPGGGIPEDPVTGSSNGCIGAFIAKHGLLPARGGAIDYVAEQGIEMGQPGRVYVRVAGAGDALTVRVGGHAVTVLEGDLLLPG